MIIIINGFSATGKTLLSRRISKALQIPVFSVDCFKEMVIDSLGTVNDELFHKYSQLSYDFLYIASERLVEVGYNVILESCFHNTESEVHKMNTLSEMYKMPMKQIYLYANKDVIWDRIQKRKSERHIGHRDLTMSYATFSEKVGKPIYEPLSIKAELLKVDTSDFEEVNFDKIIMFCRNQTQPIQH